MLRVHRAGKLRLHCGLAFRHRLQVVAHAYDLRDIIHLAVEVGNDGRWKFHRPLLAIDMRAMALWHEPIDAAIDPHNELVRFDNFDHGCDNILLQHALLDHAEIWPNEKSAVERGDWRRECERLDQHLHPARRAPARDREGDTSLAHLVHCGFRALGQHLLARDESAIDIRE